MREQKWTVLISGHRHLNSVLGHHLLEQLSRSSVVDQHVQSLLLAVYLPGELPHRGERGEVKFSRDDALVPRLFYQFLCENEKFFSSNDSRRENSNYLAQFPFPNSISCMQILIKLKINAIEGNLAILPASLLVLQLHRFDFINKNA